MIVIEAKSMLKLIQNNDLQLSLDATHGTTWNRCLLHVCSVIDERHHFHPAACVFASSETKMSSKFPLKIILQLCQRMCGGDAPDV